MRLRNSERVGRVLSIFDPISLPQKLALLFKDYQRTGKTQTDILFLVRQSGDRILGITPS